jgi:environmental stress-induced protein Ves
MTVRVVRRADHQRMPWRNGGGLTAQVACSPDGSGTADFDWRVSFAEVERTGEFSSFPGVDRVIVLVEGPAMTLTVDGLPHVLQPHLPFAFDGESAVRCEVWGPTFDLNVMTRRGRADASVEVLELDQALRPIRSAGHLLVAVLAGEVMAADAAQVRELGVGDVVVSDERSSLSLGGTGRVATITLTDRRSERSPTAG